MSVTFYIGNGNENHHFDMNLSNVNAQAVLDMFGIDAYSDDGLVGECNPQTIIDGVDFVRNMNRAGCSPLVKETIVQRNIIDCGRIAEQVARYLDGFHTLASHAKVLGKNVAWS